MAFCKNCGTQNSDDKKFCIKCGNALAKVDTHQVPVETKQAPVETKIIQQTEVPVANTYEQEYEAQFAKPKKKKLWIILTTIFILAIGGLAVWYFLKEAKPLFVKFALPNELKLRSSQFDASDANILYAVSYGTEIQVFKEEGEWSSVKVNDQKGFMKSKYLVDGKDFFEMNAITRSCGAVDTINETRFKRSLLNYFRKNNYTWEIDKAFNDKYFDGKASEGKSFWKIKQTSIDSKTIVRGKFNGIGKKGFACILENQNGTERKLVVFIYDENENEIYSRDFSNNNFQNLEITLPNTASWEINGQYTYLSNDAIIVNNSTGEYSIVYYNGSTVELYLQPFDIGD
jgi:zinc-ribbon domain